MRQQSGQHRSMTAPTLPQTRKVPRDSFALRLVALRHDLELSQEEIADLCGVKRPTWATWEKGSVPRNQAEVARKISEATGYSLSWLLFGSTPPSPDGPADEIGPGRFQVRVLAQEHRHKQIYPFHVVKVPA